MRFVPRNANSQNDGVSLEKPHAGNKGRAVHSIAAGKNFIFQSSCVASQRGAAAERLNEPETVGFLKLNAATVSVRRLAGA